MLAAAGAALLTQLPAEGNALVTLLPGFAVSGFGLGAAFVAATTTAMAHVDPHDAGMTSGLINTGRELGASLGIAFVSTLAASSLGTPAAGVDGFGVAFAGAAIVAAVMALVALWLVPAGRPPGHHRAGVRALSP